MSTYRSAYPNRLTYIFFTVLRGSSLAFYPPLYVLLFAHLPAAYLDYEIFIKK